MGAVPPGVAAAAWRMHLSAPAMSRTLGRIREAVGDPIMVRAGRNLVPTPRALELQEQVRQLVEQATGLFHSGEHFDLAGLGRYFTLRANNVLVGDMAARLLQELGREAPRCTLRFVPEVDHDDAALRRNRIDLFIGALPGLEPEAKTQRLLSTRFVGLVRRDHLTAPTFRRESPAGRTWAPGHGAAILEGQGIRATPHERLGDPVNEITRAVGELGCDSSLMGTRGMNNFSNLFMGSVATRVVHEVSVPLVLVK